MSNRLTTLCWGFALGKFEQVWLFNSLAWQHPHTPLSVHICLLYQIHPILYSKQETASVLHTRIFGEKLYLIFPCIEHNSLFLNKLKYILDNHNSIVVG